MLLDTALARTLHEAFQKSLDELMDFIVRQEGRIAPAGCIARSGLQRASRNRNETVH
jgi:hypothetical protein